MMIMLRKRKRKESADRALAYTPVLMKLGVDEGDRPGSGPP